MDGIVHEVAKSQTHGATFTFTFILGRRCLQAPELL